MILLQDVSCMKTYDIEINFYEGLAPMEIRRIGIIKIYCIGETRD